MSLNTPNQRRKTGGIKPEDLYSKATMFKFDMWYAEVLCQNMIPIQKRKYWAA